MTQEKIIIVLQRLSQIEDDISVPKNVRYRIKNAIIALEEGNKEIDVKIDKALEELSEIDNDPNIPVYTRTQIWNIVSALECK